MRPDIDIPKLEALRMQADLNSAAIRGISDLYQAAKNQRDDLRSVVLHSLSRDAGRKWEANGHGPYELLALDPEEQKRISAPVPTLHALVAAMDRLSTLVRRTELMRAEHAPHAAMVARFNTFAECRA